MKTRLRAGAAVFLLVSLLATSWPARAAGGTILVTTTDGTVLPGTDDGQCSLREAVQAASTLGGKSVNEDCTGGTPDTDTIAFDLPGSGVQTISLTTALEINTPVIIDGTTDPDYLGTPVVRLDGGDALTYGLWLQDLADSSTVKGLMVTRFTYGELLANQADSLQVQANYFGTDGSSDLGGYGGVILQNSTNVILGGSTPVDRNVIAGHLVDLSLNGDATGNVVRGNYIGVLANGVTAPSGSLRGISLSPFPNPGTAPTANTFGGLLPGQGNVIAGHTSNEIEIISDGQSFSDGNFIQGNIIGLTSNGDAVPNIPSGNGIHIVNSDNTLIEKNTISGTAGNGIHLYLDPSWNTGGSPTAPDATVIRANRIGTSLDGQSALGNGTGIYLEDATNTIVGGDGDLAQRNLVSGNTIGIKVKGGAGNSVISNWIGVDASGLASLPNSSLGIESDAAVGVSRNWIANSPTGIQLNGAGSFGLAEQNCITANNTGVDNTTGFNTVFELAWWGASTGPAGSGPGSGDPVSADVDFTPFLTTAPGTCSILANASFEIDAEPNKRPDDWTLKNFSGATDKRDCTKSMDGPCSVKMVGNGKSKSVKQTIVLAGNTGDELVLSLWSRAKSVPAGSVYRLQVKLYDGSTLVASKTRNFGTGTHGFKQVSGSIMATAPYDHIVYAITFKAPSGTAWFDDAVLSQVP